MISYPVLLSKTRRSVMKKLLFLSLLAILSCEKVVIDDADGGSDTPASASNGNLMVSVSQVGQMSFSDFTSANVTVASTRLNYAIYTTTGTRVKQINQKQGAAGYGSASFQLSAGTYQLVVVAHSSDGNPTMTDPAKINFTNAQGFTDTFLYSEEVTIGSQPQTLHVSLGRIVAQCRFIINDDYPQGVARMRFYYTGGSGTFNAYTGLGSVNSRQDVKFDVSAGQKQFELYTFLHNTEGTIRLKVTALDAMDGVHHEREFNVSLAQRKISCLSGNFFTDGGFQITTIYPDNQAGGWEGEINYPL